MDTVVGTVTQSVTVVTMTVRETVTVRGTMTATVLV